MVSQCNSLYVWFKTGQQQQQQKLVKRPIKGAGKGIIFIKCQALCQKVRIQQGTSLQPVFKKLKTNSN